MKDRLEEELQVIISDQDIWEAIEVINQEKRALKAMF